MPTIEPEQKVFAIVLTGEFNPAIFHPAWLVQNELVAVEEAESANELICTNEMSTFILDETHFQVERHRFGLTTKDESKAPWICDLAVAIFTLLEHTPLTALGLNFNIRFAIEDQESWNRAGHALAPKGSWDGILENPGMLSVAMRGKREACSADRIDFRVQPLSDFPNGVFVGINQHYELATDLNTPVFVRNQTAMKILNSDWNSFRAYAGSASMQLLNNAISK